jgi:protein-disulfide isomerase
MNRRNAVLTALAVAVAACGGTDAASTAVFETRIAGIATQAALDVPAWQACRSSQAALAQVNADLDLGNAVGVRGTPTLVVNGVVLLGPSDATLRATVDAALAQAQASGIPAADYYAQTVPGVPVGASPVRGPADAWVTVVEFADFQCPACRYAEPTIEALATEYGSNVRLVFKHYPLRMHAWADDVAVASQCAHEQGRFWEFHDRVFAGWAGLFGGL